MEHLNISGAILVKLTANNRQKLEKIQEAIVNVDVVGGMISFDVKPAGFKKVRVEVIADVTVGSSSELLSLLHGLAKMSTRVARVNVSSGSADPWGKVVQLFT